MNWHDIECSALKRHKVAEMNCSLAFADPIRAAVAACTSYYYRREAGSS
jgi:hypothetical protein